MSESTDSSSEKQGFFSRLFRPRRHPEPQGPAGKRAYVIGDIHGCHDQMLDLLARIEADDARRKSAETHIIFLGDLIDRGPKSREVLDFLIDYKPAFATPHFIMGNHEEVMLGVMDGKEKMLQSWFEFGGRECARSYGVDNLGSVLFAPEMILKQLREKVPPRHVEFMRGFLDYLEFGDYLCVHAGIKPGIPLGEQANRDLRWIRDPFLSHRRPHEFIVVHGHTVVDEPQTHNNRIALDTGVYKSEKLSCLVIDENIRDFIKTK